MIPFAIPALLRGHWKLIVLAMLLAGIGIQQLRVTGLESSLSAEKEGRSADRKKYERAQAEATSKALAAKATKEAEYARKADEADSRSDDLAAKYRAIVLRLSAAQGKARRADMPQPSEAASRPDGPDRLAVLPLGQLMIPEEDAFKCGAIAARLVSARGWALSLEK